MPTRQGILGRKVGMTRHFAEDGTVVSVTVVEAGPCLVTQVKTPEGDGYGAVQIGFEESKRLNMPQRGHLKGLPPLRYLREVRTDDAASYERGQRLDVGMFKVGDLVDVIGVSKGKGFAGVMKRYGWHGGGASHGSMSHRRPASSGATDAARVFPGTGKPGHMGAVRVTVKGLEVVRADAERSLLVLRGAVPGPPGGIVRVTKAPVRPRRVARAKVVGVRQ